MRLLLKILGGFLLLLFTGVGVITLYIYTHTDEIKKEALNQLNIYLKVPVKVAHIDITWWDHFPEVSLRLKEVYIPSTPANSDGAGLLSCKEISVGFDFWDLYHRDYRFKSIYISGGQVYAYRDASGQSNYNILKQDTAENASTQGVRIQLKKVRVDDVLVVWNSGPQRAKYHVSQALFAGNFESDRFDIKSEVKGTLQQLITDEFKHLDPETLALEAEIYADHLKKQYTFKKGLLKTGSLELLLSGMFQHDSTWNTDIHLSQKACAIGALVRWFPESWQQQVRQYEPQGFIGIDIYAKGVTAANHWPEIRFEGMLKEGSFKDEKHQRYFSQIGMRLHGVMPGNGRSPTIHINDFKATTGQIRCKGSLNYENGQWTGQALLAGPLKDINPFLTGSLTFDAGSFESDVAFSGASTDVEQGNISKIEIKKFNFQVQSTNFNWGENRVEGISLDAQLDQNDLKLGSLICKVNDAPVKIKAEVLQFLPWMFGHGKLEIQSEVSFGQLELKSIDSEDTSGPAMSWPDTRVALSGEAFIYGKHHIYKPKLTVDFRKGVLRVPEAHCEVFEGSLDIKDLLYDLVRRQLVFQADVHRIQLSALFSGLDNFGQQVITGKHLEGVFSAGAIKASVPIDLKGKPIYDKLTLETDMLIQEGRLRDFEPIYALSKFIKLEELRDIRFAELKNSISIHDNNIYIPDMQIKNSALNLQMSGTHSFENILDYHLKVLLKEVLLHKRKARTSDDFGSFEPTADKGINLYLYMQGPMDKLKIGYDRRQAREGTKQRMKEEKKQIREIFKREGKLFRKDTKLNPDDRDSVPEEEIKWDEGGG